MMRFPVEILSRGKDFSKYIDRHLSTDVYGLDLSKQKDLDPKVLTHLGESKNAGAILYLNVMYTNIGYSEIVALWKSPTFGNLVSDSPIYEEYTGNPMVTIEVEIGHTKVLRQYHKKLFDYPLPLLSDFDITFGHRCVGKPWVRRGYKKIVLLDHGKQLSPNRKSKWKNEDIIFSQC